MSRKVGAGGALGRADEAPVLGCDLAIEHPGAVAHNELVLSGWAASPHGISGVVVQIDDRLLHASYGLETPWVAESMPDVAGAAQAGYSLRLDTSAWTPGTRRVTVAAFDGEGRRGEITGAVEVLPFAEPAYTREENLARIAEGGIAMWLEEPRTIEGEAEVEAPVEISGWAYCREGLESVIVTVDGRRSYEALRPIVRPDLIEAYGEEVAGEAGFALRLHPSELPPGVHALTVVAVAAGGAAVGVEGTVACLPEPEPRPAPAAGEAVAVDWLADRTRPRKRSGFGERYDPERHAGLMLETEHRLRYRWALQLAEGRAVLDLGCGVGWGAALLAEGGAERVVGIEAEEEALGAARRRAEGLAVELVRGDGQALPFKDASFDLVTCFHALERTHEPELALTELRRVLRPEGILLISIEPAGARASARDGLGSAELERALRERFANVSLRRQEAFLASALLDGEGGSPTVEVELSPLDERRDRAGHVVAIAGDGDLPSLEGLAAAAPPRALHRLRDAALTWESRALNAEADSAASRNMANLAQMHQRDTVELLRDSEAKARAQLEATRAEGDRALAERDEARRELDEARAELEALERELAGARREIASGAAGLEQLRDQVDERERRLGEIEGQLQTQEASLSWRLTRPLRWAKRQMLIARSAVRRGGRP